MELADQRIVVTGASRGIGRAIALACARAGAVVGIGHLANEEAARALADEIAKESLPTPRLLRFDVRDEPSAKAAFTGFLEHEKKIDALVCAAGVSFPDLLVHAPLDRVREAIDVNLFGAILCTQLALQPMVRARGGVIIHVGSVAATRPFRGQSVYAATKGALESFTRAIAAEHARRNIRALCVRLGPVDTDMLAPTRALAEDELLARVPLKRVAHADEIAALVVPLLSSRASFMTGAIIPIDGGWEVG